MNNNRKVNKISKDNSAKHLYDEFAATMGNRSREVAV